MNTKESLYWWRLSFAFPSSFEELIICELCRLEVSEYAVKCDPDNPNESSLFIWFHSDQSSKIQRDTFWDSLFEAIQQFGLHLPWHSWEKINDEDWSNAWKMHWGPDPIGKKLLILPSWLEMPEEYSNRFVLRLDPGSAFGTGSHPTTRLCLEALENSPPTGMRVLDVGCGSGILGLAALSLGAKEVFALDIDSLAVRASNENAYLNGYVHELQAYHGSLEVFQTKAKDKADLLLCNTLAPVIESLAPTFKSLLSKNGSAILSGLLVEQIPKIRNLLQPLGFVVISSVEKEGWALLQVAVPQVL